MNNYENKIPLVLQCLLWIIPINIYVLADWWGSGIQWAIFRYQQAFYNNENVSSMIFFNREIHWILSSTITGKTAISIILWGCGILLLCAGTAAIVIAIQQENAQYIRWGAFFNICGAVAFTGAIINLYGIMLHGPAGIAIPFGIPVILVVAYIQYRSTVNRVTDDEDDGEEISADDESASS